MFAPILLSLCHKTYSFHMDVNVVAFSISPFSLRQPKRVSSSKEKRTRKEMKEME